MNVEYTTSDNVKVVLPEQAASPPDWTRIGESSAPVTPGLIIWRSISTGVTMATIGSSPSAPNGPWQRVGRLGEDVQVDDLRAEPDETVVASTDRSESERQRLEQARLVQELRRQRDSDELETQRREEEQREERWRAWARAERSDAVLRISLARRSPLFSRSSSRSRARSSVMSPGRDPWSISARRTHRRRVSRLTSSFAAIEQSAFHRDG